MKNLRTYSLCVCMSLFSLCAAAQTETVPVNEPDYNKPRLFTALPDRIAIDIRMLTAVLDNSVGRPVDITFQPSFRYAGQVVSVASQEDNNMKSVVIRSSNYPGSTLTFTKTINADGTVSYSGRILSFSHGDLFELQNQNGQYSFAKKKFYDLINE